MDLTKQFKKKKSLHPLREHLRPEFVHMPDKEVREICRSFVGIKNMLLKEEPEVHRLLNRMKGLCNIFPTKFVVLHLRRTIPQKQHQNLNSFLVFCRIEKVNPDVPYSIDFFKYLMEEGRNINFRPSFRQ